MVNSEQPADKWYILEHIHPLFHDGGMVFLNSNTGQWCTINRLTGATILHATGLLSSMKPDWPELKGGCEPTAELVAKTKEAGLLTTYAPQSQSPADYPYAAPYEGAELLEAGNVLITQRRPSIELPDDLAAEAGMAIEEAQSLIEKVRSGAAFSLLAETFKHARKSAASRSLDEAYTIARAVYQTGYTFPGRIACLERVMSTVLLGARRNVEIYAQFGAGVDPISFHAWPAAGDNLTPICLENDEAIGGRYYPVYTI